jgi:hypothetical protein
MNKNKNNNNYLSKTLLCLAVGGGLTYIRKFKNNNNIETNNIDTIFNTKKENINNTPVIYTKEERKDIFNEFIKSKKIINSTENNELKINQTVNTEIIQTQNNELNNDINHITNNELNINIPTTNNIYKFYTKKDCYYKIQINIEILEDLSSIIINFNNFNYNHKINEKNIKFIFDNIIFDNTYQTLEIKELNNKLFSKFNIFIKEYSINNLHINNGIIIIIENNNSYPYFLNNNLLPDFVEKEEF